MRLGTETGSLVNHILSTSGGQKVENGMPATVTYWSDRDGATVTAINTSRKIVTVQIDKAIRVDDNGTSEMQTYRYERDPEGKEFFFKQDRKGVFRQVKRNVTTNRWNFVTGGLGVFFGKRMAYYDYSF